MSDGIAVSQIAGRVPQIIGPFHFEYNTPGMNSNGEDGFLLAALPDGAIILQVMLNITEGFARSVGDPIIYINIGSSDYLPPDDLFGAICQFTVNDLLAITSAHTATGILFGPSQSVFGAVDDVAGGALVVQGTDGLTAGKADLYAVALLP